MSQINVTKRRHSLHRNSVDNLYSAVYAAQDGDTIVIHSKKNYLGANVKTLPIKKSLYIQGANPRSRPTIYVNNHQIAFGMVQGNLQLKDVNIQLSAQAMGIETTMNYSGNIVLDNVSIRHKGNIIPKEYSLGLFAWGSQVQPQLYANIVLSNCDIDYAQVDASYITAQNSKIGRLDGLVSSADSSRGQYANVELTHIQVVNLNPQQQPQILQQVSTKGMLHVIGNTNINGLRFVNGIAKPNRPLSGLFSNPQRVLQEFGTPIDKMPMIYTDSLPIKNVVSSINISHVEYDPLLLRLQPKQALTKPYSFDFNKVHMTLKDSTIQPNYLGPRNHTVGGSLMLEDVNDKSHWADKGTQAGRKGSTQSELFSTLPTGSEIHAAAAVDPVKKLDNMIGLNGVKDTIKRMIASAEVSHYNYQHGNQHMGKKRLHMPMNTILQGPPGTGKSTVAKLIWQILYKRGVVGSNFVKISGDDLKAGYQGQTAAKVERLVGSAMGGVLFIDEAYGLTQGRKNGGDEFAHEALDTLTNELNNGDNEYNMMCIMAGYTYPMQQLLDSNEGLHRRFSHIITFPNYTEDQMTQILALMMRQQHQQTADNQAALALSKGLKTVVDATKSTPGGNGNAGTASLYLDDVKSCRDARIVYHDGGINKSNRNIITAPDAIQGAKLLAQKEQSE